MKAGIRTLVASSASFFIGLATSVGDFRVPQPVANALLLAGVAGYLFWLLTTSFVSRGLPLQPRWRHLAIGTVILIASGVGWWMLPSTRTAQTIPPRIVQWGNVNGTTTTYAVVDGSHVARDFRDRFFLLLITRARDNAIDRMADSTIDVSNRFEIPSSRVQINVPHGSATLRRVATTGDGVIELVLLAVPKGTTLRQIASAGHVKANGGIVIDQKAFNGLRSITVPIRQ